MNSIPRSSLFPEELYLFSESLRRTKILKNKKIKKNCAWGRVEDKQEVPEGIIPLTYMSSQNSIKNGLNVPVWNVKCYLSVS